MKNSLDIRHSEITKTTTITSERVVCKLEHSSAERMLTWSFLVGRMLGGNSRAGEVLFVDYLKYEDSEIQKIGSIFEHVNNALSYWESLHIDIVRGRWRQVVEIQIKHFLDKADADFSVLFLPARHYDSEDFPRLPANKVVVIF